MGLVPRLNSSLDRWLLLFFRLRRPSATYFLRREVLVAQSKVEKRFLGCGGLRVGQFWRVRSNVVFKDLVAGLRFCGQRRRGGGGVSLERSRAKVERIPRTFVEDAVPEVFRGGFLLPRDPAQGYTRYQREKCRTSKKGSGLTRHLPLGPSTRQNPPLSAPRPRSWPFACLCEG